MRRLEFIGLIAASWALSSGLVSAAEAAPAAGQTVAEWQDAVTVNLEARGDKMGFSVDPCALRPPFAGAPNTYLSRAFSQDDKMVLALVAVRDGRVTEWKEFELPGFEGWFTHALRACKGKLLEIRFDADFRSDIVGTVRASRWRRLGPRADDVFFSSSRRSTRGR